MKTYRRIAEKIQTDLVGTTRFQELAQKVVDAAVKELKLNGAAVFRLNTERTQLSAYTYAHRFRTIIDRLLPKKFGGLSIPIATIENLAVRTITENSRQQSVLLSDFSKHVLPDSIVHNIQRVMGAKLFASYPIRDAGNSAVGVMMFAIDVTTISPELEKLFLFFTEHIAVIFTHAVDVERIIAEYRSERKISIVRKSKEIPRIKFTLRITARQQRYILRHIKGSTRTKAIFIRNLLDSLIEKE
ncbi:MAG: hypothetical protein Q7S16_05000 [bacterium]|nr:hypothetical protein [bacterium]